MSGSRSGSACQADPMRGLEGKVVVVAGGAGGIGTATSLRLAQEGCKVVVGDISDEGAAVVAAIKGSGGEATACSVDISDDSSVGALIATAVEVYGGIDLFHANAADLSIVMSDTNALDIDLDIWDRTLNVNLRGFLLCTRHAIPQFLERGGGAMVYTSSAASFVGEPERPAYAAAKSGVNALMRHVASKYGKKHIRANAIAPGLIVSDRMRAVMPEAALDGTLKR